MKKKQTVSKLKIRKNDNVVVIAGNYKGSKGRVLAIIKQKNQAIVEGVRIISKHSKPTKDNPDGGIIKKEAPIHISNLMLLDSKSQEGVRVGRRYNDKNKLVRYSKKSGEEI